MRALTSGEAHAEETRALADADAAFRRLAAAEDAFDDAAVGDIHRRRAAVDAAAARSHYTLAVLGRDVTQRTRLLNQLLGEAFVDPTRRDAVGGTIRFRHGSSLDYRARFAGGEAEEFAELVPDRSEELAEEVARKRGRVEEAKASLDAIHRRLGRKARALDTRRVEVADAEAELERLHNRRAAAARAAERAAAERSTALETAGARWVGVPGYLRARPPWWAFWAWIARLLTGWRHRDALAGAATTRQRAERLHHQRDSAEAKARRAHEELLACESRCALLRAAYEEEERRCAAARDEERAHGARLSECEQELGQADARFSAFVDNRRRRFLDRVRALTDGRAGQLESLQVELDSLPAGIEIIDVSGADHALDLQRVWELVDREADGCAVAGELPREAEALFGGVIRSATPDELVVLLRRARVLRAARQAAEACKVGRQSLEAAGRRAAEETRRRVEALHKEREAGTRRLENGLVRVQADVKGRAASALSQAGHHIEREIDRLRAAWLAQVRRVETLAALRSTLASVETEALEAIPAVAADARGLLVSTLSGILADLVPALADERLADAKVASPAWNEFEFSPFPADLRRALRVAPSRLGVHLQAFATTRAACQEALDSRVERLRRRAVANLLNLEPQTASHLQSALNEMALSLQQAQRRHYQAALDELRADSEARAQPGRDELRAEIDTLSTSLEEHARGLASGL